MIKVLLLTVTILILVILGLAMKIIFHKSHSFPETSAGHNLEMKKRGIVCPKKEEPFCNGINNNSDCSNCSSLDNNHQN